MKKATTFCLSCFQLMGYQTILQWSQYAVSQVHIHLHLKYTTVYLAPLKIVLLLTDLLAFETLFSSIRQWSGSVVALWEHFLLIFLWTCPDLLQQSMG